MTDINCMHITYRNIILLLLATMLMACVHQPAIGEVDHFVKKRDLCDHLRGEIPDPDPAHPEDMDEVIKNINRSCKGTDAELQRLKVRYASDTKIMEILSRYENRIEATH